MAARMRGSVTSAGRIWVSTMLKRADSDMRKPREKLHRLIGVPACPGQRGFLGPWPSRWRPCPELNRGSRICYSRSPLRPWPQASECRREATWRSGDAADCKSVNPGSIPGVASTHLPPNSGYKLAHNQSRGDFMMFAFRHRRLCRRPARFARRAALAAEILIKDAKSQPESLAACAGRHPDRGQRLHALTSTRSSPARRRRKSSSTPAPKAPAPSSSASWWMATRCGAAC